jgi:hypothetical protein
MTRQILTRSERVEMCAFYDFIVIKISVRFYAFFSVVCLTGYMMNYFVYRIVYEKVI